MEHLCCSAAAEMEDSRDGFVIDVKIEGFAFKDTDGKLDAPGVEVLDILPKLAKNLSWDMMVVVLLLIKGRGQLRNKK